MTHQAPTLRVGIVGAGLWTERAHLPAFSRQPGVVVRGIADPDLGRAERLASQFGVERAVRDHESLLDLGLDALAIVAPDDVHHRVAGAALAAGLPILCEKPLARTVEESAELATRAAQLGRVTKLGFVFRYSPALRRIHELAREGYVGRVHSLVVFSQNPQFIDPAAPLHWKMERARAGGGVYVEYGSHSLDLARWLCGEIREVCANARTVVPERMAADGRGPLTVDVDDVCSWLATLEGGVEATFHASWASMHQPWGDLAVFGDRGSLVWRRRDDAWPFAEVYGATREAATPELLPLPTRLTDGLEWASTWRECFMGNLVRRFVAEVRGEAPAEGATFDDGHRAQLALAAIGTSLAEHRWVRVPEV
jgi:predicted dehydrogenase